MCWDVRLWYDASRSSGSSPSSDLKRALRMFLTGSARSVA